MAERPDMRNFLQLGVPDLGTVPMAAPAGPCGGGLANCDDLAEAELKAFQRLTEGLTHTTQGLTGLLEVMRTTVTVYEDSAITTAAEIRAAEIPREAAYDPAKNLPDVAPELSVPRPGQGA